MAFTLLASALALATMALALGLFNQKSTLTENKTQLAGTCAMREMEIKRLSETYAGREAEMTQLKAAYMQQEGTLHDLVSDYAKRELLAKQSDELKAKLNSVVLDLLILAKTDDDAKAIIAKYSIKEIPPVPGVPAATVPK